MALSHPILLRVHGPDRRWLRLGHSAARRWVSKRRLVNAMVWGVVVAVGGGGVGWGQTAAYDFGSPDAVEQLMIEYVNRSRMFPAVEAQGYRDAADAAKRAPDQLDWNLADAYTKWGVNRAVAVQRISALPVVPPVAPSGALATVARQHTHWMFVNVKQSHTQPPATSGTDSIVRRISATGYNWAGLGENIYAYGRDVYHMHAAFEVDWGGSDYGMQNPPGHRLNTHSKDHREIGVGIRFGSSGYGAEDVGPALTTVNFGSQRGSPTFVTGVAYCDLNGNQRYDLHEGVGGLRVDVAGAAFHAITAAGGGYAVPVPTTAATRAVSLSGFRATGQGTAAIIDGKNVKVDFALGYVPPVVAGPSHGGVGQPADFSFSTTPGATAYEVVTGGVAVAAAEKADASTNFTYYVTPGRYSVVQASVRVGAEGGAIHLAHPVLEDQWVMLNPTYVPGASGSVTFQSWLRGSSVRQVARCQISTDDGQSWKDAWTKVGAASGASTWSPVTVSLAAYAGRLVRLRFNYTAKGDAWQAGLGVGSGWFVDEIGFLDTEQLTAPQTMTVPADGPAATVSYTPAVSGDMLVAARPVVSGRRGSFAPAHRLGVGAPTPYVQWAFQEEARLGLGRGSLAFHGGAPSGPDGVPGLVRYALGVPADQSAAARLPQAEVVSGGLCVTYFRDLARTDVQVGLQVSGDYEQWLEPGSAGAPRVLSDTVLGVAGTLERRCAVIAPSQGRVAARLRVTPL